jgi:hypothetical protein
MNAAEIFTYAVLGCGVIAVAVQYGIAKGREQAVQRIERQRGVEVKALLEYVAMAWRRR